MRQAEVKKLTARDCPTRSAQEKSSYDSVSRNRTTEEARSWLKSESFWVREGLREAAQPSKWTLQKWIKTAGVDDAVAEALLRHIGEGQDALGFARSLEDPDRIRGLLFRDRWLEDAIVNSIATAIARLCNDGEELSAELQVCKLCMSNTATS